jgi:hypothetical protein
MLNMALLSRWQNWFTVWLMIAIGLTGLHVFVANIPDYSTGDD